MVELRRLPAPGQLAQHDDHRGREKAQERRDDDTPATTRPDWHALVDALRRQEE